MSLSSGISGQGRFELSKVLGSGVRFITPSDVSDALDLDADDAARKLARWAKDGWVRRVRRGLYIGVPVDAANPKGWTEDVLLVADAVWSPCYFTGWTAAHHWSLTDQVFRTTVLKSNRRVRNSKDTLLDHEYLVSHTPPDSLSWGMRSEWRDNVRLRFADPARTVVDLLDMPKLGGGIRNVADIVRVYLEEGDPHLLVDYGDRLGNRAIFKRLGYIVEFFSPLHVQLIDACRARVSEGISALDPDGPSGGRRAMRWTLRINVNLTDEGPS
jgi:predicted transcriptional regulator of viral defense system